jgi:hypothetical protein
MVGKSQRISPFQLSGRICLANLVAVIRICRRCQSLGRLTPAFSDHNDETAVNYQFKKQSLLEVWLVNTSTVFRR